MKKKSAYYLVGNAHLDPLWQWHWQEGSAEAKATIRSALDRMKEFPEYVFVCSSASVYQWIEEFSPEMFKEIQQRVAEGRFVVVGGMHVQPDCNNPSGEGFARQSLYAQRYFKEKLGVTATVGYNVDSFGHNLMLPQILKKSGMRDYIFMRPGQHEKGLESDVFNWVSPDGSSVTAYRIMDWYAFFFNDMDFLVKRLNDVDEQTRTDLDEVLLFYGIGNHGGGPSVRNLELLRQYRQEHPEKEFIYSNITDFFDHLRASGKELPSFYDDLQHHASGCYSTVSFVKNGIRRGETELVAAEAYSVLASKLCGKRARTKEFEEAWKQICFLHFHDSMGGCSMKEAHQDAAYQYGAALNTAAVEENNALQTISWIINTSDRSKGVPVVVFNPNGFDVEQLVQVNQYATYIVDCDGNDVPCQSVRSSTEECSWRTDVLFKAKVPALGYAVYYMIDKAPEGPANKLRFDLSGKGSSVTATAYAGFRTANDKEETVLENQIFRIAFELYSGYITSFLDKRTGKELLAGRAAVPTVIDEYYQDTWSHAKNYFTDVMARFSDAEVTVVENGPVRATVKVVSRYNDSRLTQYFSLEPGSDKLTVRAEVDWHEKHKMLKLAWPMDISNPKAYYEIPFGVIERPADGEEEPGLMWTAVKGDNGSFAIINSDTYSSSVKDGTIYHTILRSPIYGDHGGPRSTESDFTEQGSRTFSYILMPVGDSWAPVIQTARQLNKPLTNIMETWHEGRLSDRPYAGLNISADNVMLSACKRSEDGTGLVLRLYETDGKTTPVTVSGDLLPVPLDVTFTPWSVNTYFLADGADSWKEVLLTEYDL